MSFTRSSFRLPPSGSSDAGHAVRGHHAVINGMVGIVAASEPCSASRSERRWPSHENYNAVAALQVEAHQTANNFYFSARVEARASTALDIAKNRLRSRLEKCQWIVRKTPAMGVFDCSRFGDCSHGLYRGDAARIVRCRTCVPRPLHRDERFGGDRHGVGTMF